MTSHSNTPYEAWIDVGGTFTDCYVRRPNGELLRSKILSSGKVLLTVGDGFSGTQLTAPELNDDPEGFWIGANLRLTDVQSGEVRVLLIVGFSAGTLELSRPVGPNSSGWRAALETHVEAPVLVTRRLLRVPLSESLPALRVRLGTTKGTNALLTRRGARTALAITAPFEDLLLIGDQTRPELFELAIHRVLPLAEMTLGISERLDAAGQVLKPLDRQQAVQQLQRAKQAGVESLAICLMHSYLNPRHEQQLLELAQEVGFAHVSCSHELAPLIEIVPRAQTAVVDAYLSPIVREYMRRLVAQFGGAEQVQLLGMTSGGGLVPWQEYYGKDSILSGPAGGVSALRQLARTLQSSAGNPDLPELIGLDMGGTSTDVCRVSGDHNLQYESTKAGVRIFTPTLPIETVASGGGSMCWFDGVSLRVGPQSAGADPGPACYGRGGPLTITDLNVFLGRIPESQFPFPIDRPAIAARLQQALVETQPTLGFADVEELAQGFRRIANEQMAAAVRTVSIAQGVDPRTQTLVGFGGAAGQHICEIAALLGVKRVVDSADAGLLSALGMGLAQQRLDAVVTAYQPLYAVNWQQLEVDTSAAQSQLIEIFAERGVSFEDLSTRRWLELRYAKTDATLTLPWSEMIPASEQVAGQFAAEHRRRYGFARPVRAPLELVAVRIEVTAAGRQGAALAKVMIAADSTSQAELLVAASSDSIDKSSSLHGALYLRSQIRPGQQLAGPAIVLNSGSTLVVETGWQVRCDAEGLLSLEREDVQDVDAQPATMDEAQPGRRNERQQLSSSEPQFDPVFRDCFAQRLSAIATQMGIVLQQTAVSVNVKQRRDYSCAIFDIQGRLLASAPHVPVHLGAMGETVRAIQREFPQPRPGDGFITNDPYRGGSHLPDITVVTPVFSEPAGELQFFVANRAHHADIGGVAPGSMSVAATRLGEEGVILPPMRVAAAGRDCSSHIRRLLQSATYPPRNIEENLSDISAQLAANARGKELLTEYAATASWPKLRLYCGYVLDAAEERVRNYFRDHPVPHSSFADFLDDGTPIQVAIAATAEGQIKIDFTGSGPISSGNFNANRSIVTAAVIYVLRCLIADELPLNEGVMRCVDLIIPVGVLNPTAAEAAVDSPAVAAGNVETSQRVVDVLLGAWGAAAASQGTMNNLLFGNSRFGFYETICGGAGATRGSHGASGVHTHMTNTRLTDPEVLEARYPVRLLQFGLRSGSGGLGRWRGGDGVIRRVEFLEPVELSLLSSRRGPYAPFGLDGGQAGSLGYNALIRIDGSRVPLASCCQVAVAAGEQLEIMTPGGGGFGSDRPT